MKILYALLFGFFSILANAQVTIRITAIPTNTPAQATFYIAGSFNNWNPGSTTSILQSDGLGAWTITIPEGAGTAEYKITRGSWASVEGNASGSYLPNRTFTFTGLPQTINITVQSWEDISGSGSASTAASNVQVLNSSFYMPQLDRYRKVWIYLPPDYFTTTKTYPVLYMQDGQNLFDNATSFAGEWQIDETLNLLHAQGDYGAIVVGIDNGGTLRLNEYSPWENPSYGGGEGDLYMQFMGETLKPYIDANFRTKPQPQYNALIGSSMGAFINTYGNVKYPQYFAKIGNFSPAYWFSLTNLENYIASSTHNLSGLKVYFVCGQNESATMVEHLNIIKNKYLLKGVSTNNIFTKIDSNGTHSELYWRGEFAAAYQWLFQGENLSTTIMDPNKWIVFQNQLGEMVVDGLMEKMKFEIFSLQGNKVDEIELKNGVNHLPKKQAAGLYIFKSKNLVKKVFLY